MIETNGVPFDSYEFWTRYRYQNALEVTENILVANMKYGDLGTYKGHNIIRIPYDCDLTAVEAILRKELDSIDWQFVTTGGSMNFPGGGEFPCFGIAPIIEMKVSTAYHATTIQRIELICKNGLLPSNKERSATGFPDTEGTIHVCEKLTCSENEKGSAIWWIEHLREKCFKGQLCGVVQIDMNRLMGGRVYQDMHSQSGLVVDRIERIPRDIITVVRGDRTDRAETKSAE